MNRRPIHGELGGTGTFDYHLADRDVVEIDTVVPAGVVLLETGTLPVRNAEHGLDNGEAGYVSLTLPELEELIGELTKARDYLREHRA